MRLIAIALLLAATVVGGVASAQEPPGRVGRLAYVQGQVALYQDPEIGWDQAYVNSPITSENSIWTEPGARAEMRVSGMAIRLDDGTQLDVARLDDEALDAFVVQGSVSVRVRWFDEGQGLDFSSPHGRFHLFGVGQYRIDVDRQRDETLVTVFNGSAALRAANGDVRIEAGSALRIYGGPNPSYERERAHEAAIDRWARERDSDWVERSSTQYVSPYMTGYEELDRYGQWIDEPGYGPLWYPARVDSDWIPYREGHWAWVRPWGWTWVADEPWGYAPYHYGRWVHVRDRWCWSPGTREARPVWAPALVAWIGGTNFSVSVGGRPAPAVGWYPLAPWERYKPWYHASDRYVTRVNRAVRSEPPREWRERQQREARNADWQTFNRDRATTVVRRDALGSRRDMRSAVVPVNRDVVRQATVVSPNNVAPREDWVRRRTEARRDQGSRTGPPPAQQQAQPAQQPQGNAAMRPAPAQRAENPAGRGDNRPRYDRERNFTAPAPAPAPATAGRPGARQPPAAQSAPQPNAAPVNPAARRPDGDRGRFEQQRQPQDQARRQQEDARRQQEQAQRQQQEQAQRHQQEAQRQQQEQGRRQQQEQGRRQQEQAQRQQQ